jgi:hypothetical protein
VDNVNAIWNGALAGKPQFFGDSTAEIVSAAMAGGGWNGDYARSFDSTNLYLMRGGGSHDSTGSGAFAFYGYSVHPYYQTSHRTILSGY